jgi:hypothetical protein
MPLFHEFAARLPQSDPANEKRTESDRRGSADFVRAEDTRTGIASRRYMRD